MLRLRITFPNMWFCCDIALKVLSSISGKDCQESCGAHEKENQGGRVTDDEELWELGTLANCWCRQLLLCALLGQSRSLFPPCWNMKSRSRHLSSSKFLRCGTFILGQRILMNSRGRGWIDGVLMTMTR